MTSFLARKPAAIALAIVVALLSLSGLALGDESKTAFQEGMKLLATGDYDGACAAFEKSDAAKPSLAARYQLGRCNESRGRFGTAHRYFLIVAAMAEEAGDADRAKTARQRAREVEPKAGQLAIIVPQDRQVEGLTVTCDGIEVPKENWGKAVPMDAGKHTIELSAPGYETQTLEAETAGPGKPVLVEAPALVASGTGGAPAPTGATPPPPPPGDEGPEMVRRSAGAFWTGVGLTAAGGLAGVGGIYLWVAGEGSELENKAGAIGLWILGGAMLGVGLPLMIVFGQKVPAGPDGEPMDEDEVPAQPAAGTVTLQPLVGPTGAGLQLTF